MEDVLAIYALPYDPAHPVICMDESCKQLIGEVREPMAHKPQKPLRIDYEYVRNGTAQIFLEVEPLAGRRHVEVRTRRTRKDWAHWINDMLTERYPQATKVRLVVDNLNIHNTASLYETFPPEQARALAQRLEIHYTPKHGSWLNIAEIELSVLKGQCLNRRIPDTDNMQKQITAWNSDRNNQRSKIIWHFTAKDARVKLKKLYPKL